MLNTSKEIIEVCMERNCRIYDLVLEEEMKNTKRTEEEIRAKVSEVVKVMEGSATENLEKETPTTYRMIDGFAKNSYRYAQEKEPIVGKFLMKAMAMAFSTSEVNGTMGKIVAAPTAGSSGILPAAIVSARDKYDLDERTIQNGLLTSIGIGQIIAKYATFAGAEGGCQAECGAASAMAASAVVEMLGGTTEQILHSASISLINILGLVCDPIAGLVQYPCAFRNASGVMNALISADMVMAGLTSFIPFEEVVQAMGEVGRALDENLRETGTGGLAATKTGCAVREDYLGLKK